MIKKPTHYRILGQQIKTSGEGGKARKTKKGDKKGARSGKQLNVIKEQIRNSWRKRERRKLKSYVWRKYLGRKGKQGP